MKNIYYKISDPLHKYFLIRGTGADQIPSMMNFPPIRLMWQPVEQQTTVFDSVYLNIPIDTPTDYANQEPRTNPIHLGTT